MPKSAAARRYARALFSLASDDQRVDAVRAEVDAIATLLRESRELRDVLFRPLHPVSERRAVLAAVTERMGVSPTLRQFCSFLVEQRRMDSFFEIALELERLANEAAGRVEGELVAATELSSDQLDRLRRSLSSRSGRDVALSVRIDPSILGGVVPKVGDLVLDGHGWGHGVGLCQYGAAGYASRGASYQLILRRYYVGATLVQLR